MSGINKVILVGHVGTEPELRTLQDGATVTSFPLATSEYFNKEGRRIEQTEWHNIIMWRALAQAAVKVLKKGLLVYIEGKARTRYYTDKAGVKRYTTEIVADTFNLLGRPADFELPVYDDTYGPARSEE